MMQPGFGIRNTKSAVTALLVVGSILFACNSKHSSTAEEPFPASGEVAGWVKSGETRTFQSENLYEYIDGDADRYVQAGIERTLTADYRFQGKADAVADVHIFKAPDGPAKLMEKESSADSRPGGVGEEARLFASSLVFRKGRFLVRITAFDEAPEVTPALVTLGRAFEKRLQRQ